jgi:ABC-type dipeptide/oligopeptide/nickel transport system ATPase component
VPTENREDVILDVRDLHTYFFPRRGVVKAVDGVSFSLRRGESLGIVGESGCGKTMTALSLVRLVPSPAARIVSGEILLEGEDLLRKSNREMRRIRGQKVAMVLQDPQTSLNPLMTVGQQLAPYPLAAGARGLAPGTSGRPGAACA